MSGSVVALSASHHDGAVTAALTVLIIPMKSTVHQITLHQTMCVTSAESSDVAVQANAFTMHGSATLIQTAKMALMKHIVS